MDRRNNQFGRKKLFRMDETTAEFNLLVQRTVQRIAFQKKLERSIQLLQQQASRGTKKVSGWRDFARNAYHTGKSLFFRKKIRPRVEGSGMGNRQFKG